MLCRRASLWPPRLEPVTVEPPNCYQPIAAMSRMILARRAEEQRREAAENIVRDTHRVMDIAQFEHRTQRKINARVAKEQVASIQQNMAQDLNRRRARYAAVTPPSCPCMQSVAKVCVNSVPDRVACHPRFRCFPQARGVAVCRG